MPGLDDENSIKNYLESVADLRVRAALTELVNEISTLRSLISEGGGGSVDLGPIETRLTSVENTLGNVVSTVAAHDTRLTSAELIISNHGTVLADLSSRANTNDTNITNILSRLSALETNQSSMQADITSNTQAIDACCG